MTIREVYIDIITSIDNKFTCLDSNDTPSVEDLFPLIGFKRNLFGIVGSSNHQLLLNIRSDQSVIPFLKVLFTSRFFNNLDFLYLSNDESSPVRKIRLKIPIAMAIQGLFFFQFLRLLTCNPLTFVKGFNGCRGSINFVVEGEALGVALGQ